VTISLEIVAVPLTLRFIIFKVLVSARLAVVILFTTKLVAVSLVTNMLVIVPVSIFTVLRMLEPLTFSEFAVIFVVIVLANTVFPDTCSELRDVPPVTLRDPAVIPLTVKLAIVAVPTILAVFNVEVPVITIDDAVT
jgi:hypothetical protein